MIRSIKGGSPARSFPRQKWNGRRFPSKIEKLRDWHTFTGKDEDILVLHAHPCSSCSLFVYHLAAIYPERIGNVSACESLGSNISRRRYFGVLNVSACSSLLVVYLNHLAAIYPERIGTVSTFKQITDHPGNQNVKWEEFQAMDWWIFVRWWLEERYDGGTGQTRLGFGKFLRYVCTNLLLNLRREISASLATAISTP